MIENKPPPTDQGGRVSMIICSYTKTPTKQCVCTYFDNSSKLGIRDCQLVFELLLYYGFCEELLQALTHLTYRSREQQGMA